MASSGWAHGVASIFAVVFWWVVLAGLTFVAGFFFGFLLLFVAGFFRALRIFVVAYCIGMYSDLCCWCRGFKDLKHEKNFILLG